MGDMRRLYKMLVLFCLLPANPLADNSIPEPSHRHLPPPVTFIGQYSFSWSGIRLGKLAFSIEETESDYKVTLSVTSAGIVNLFTHHESDTIITGKRSAERYAPEHYESNYKTKKKPRHLLVVYDAKGTITQEVVEPPEDRNERPEVPHDLKDKSYDPLTALLALRSGLLTFNAFDAKRLYEVTAKDSIKGSLSILGKDRKAVRYTLARKPLSGLTEKEKKEYAQGEPLLYFYFSDDEKHIPLYIKMPLMLGSVTGTLTKECATWNECKVK